MFGTRLSIIPLASILSFLVFSNALAALPSDIQRLLDTLPGKQLSVEVVISRAVQASDAYTAIQAQRLSKDVPLLQASAPLETRLTANVMALRDRREAQSFVSPNKADTNSVLFSVNSYFQTGTTLAFELTHNKSDMAFPTFSALSNFETQGALTLSQNLWQDAFGRGTRAGTAAGRLLSEANELAIQDSVDEFVLGLVQLYYGAWLAQAQLEAAKESLAYRLRLLEITQLKSRRGTAEEQDLLQVKSAHLNAKVQYDQAAQNLGDRWRSLVFTLKLPESWTRANPAEIPVTLDAPAKEALDLCGTPSNLNAPPRDNPASRRAALTAEAAALSNTRALSASKPDLEFRAMLSSNGVDPSMSPTLSETVKLEHPAWSLGFQLTLPMDSYAEKANVLSSLTSRIQADAQVSQASDSLRTEWIAGCTDLQRADQSYRSRKEAHAAQRKRAEIEESRFRIGRTGILQVIQAADDATFAQVNLALAEVEKRTAAWRVRRLANRVQDYLTQLKHPASTEVHHESAD